MSRALAGRLDRLARRLPPPAAENDPEALTAEQLRRMPDAELHARFAQRMAEWERSPEGQALAAQLAAMSDDQLVATWERLPRYRDVCRGRRQ